ncbi:hypothetical protein P3S68_023383 [Capsicum galapagoense]
MAEILFNLATEILKSMGSLAAEEFLPSKPYSLMQRSSSSNLVRDWIKRLNKVFFEADDLLDDVATKVKHRKLFNKVGIFFSKSNPIIYNYKISHRLKSIRRDLDVIAKDKASLNLVERRQQPLLPEPYSVQLNLDRETYSFVPNGEVIGRSDDKKKIVNFLLDSKVEENVVVISNVGLGGLGKTTLAQCVFSDEMIKKTFDKTLWKDNYPQLDAVQNELRKMLDGKKYLLVLDDVWNEDPLKWSRLKNMLISEAKRSKILPTTRSYVVAKVSGSVHKHKLGDLSEEEAWTFFEKMAFGCNKESKNLNLVEIGKEIVRKCGGVPLAIRSEMMAILRLSYNYLPRHLKICFAYCSLYPKDFEIQRFDLVDMWIAQGFIQSTTSNRDNVKDVANSYFVDLLSFFQETEEHESFMQFYKMHDLIHDLAKEVADGEFFSIIKPEDIKIVPDQNLHASFLLWINGSSAFPNSFYRKYMKLRTFSYLNSYSMSVMSNSTLERMISSFSRLRVLHLGHLGIEFLPQSLGGLKHLGYLSISSLSIGTLPNTITKLHNLQILKLDDCRRLQNLPRDNWRLLTSLVHLDFDGCSSLEDMPAEIGQVTSLRTLPSFIIGKESCISGQASDKLNKLKGLVDLRNSLSIKFMGRVGAIGERTPTGVMKRMKHLRQLNVDFEYGYHRDVDTGAHLMIWVDDCHTCQKLPPLWKLPSLQSLELRNLGRLEGYDDKFMQPSKTPERYYFSSLKQLELKGISEKISKQILCPSPHHPSPLCNLKELTVDFVEGLATMSEDVFKNLMSLQSLSIKNCENLISLSTCLTHLTSLETLTITYCPELDLSNEEKMQFQVPGNLSTLNLWELDKLMSLPLWLRHFSATLKSLYISGCPNFTTIPEWIGDLVALNLLEIYECPMLTSLTEAMRSLTALQRLNILWCSSILKRRCEKQIGGDWPKIAHIPTVLT